MRVEPWCVKIEITLAELNPNGVLGGYQVSHLSNPIKK
jgi:hypothetical protein